MEKIYIQENNETEKYEISFKYDANTISKIKKIKGAFWNKTEKVWLLPLTEKTKQMLYILFDEQELQFHKVNHYNSQNNDDYIEEARNVLMLKGYSPKTIKVYVNNIVRFEKYFNKELINITEEDVKNYLLMLVNCECSHSYINQCISSLKFLYHQIIKKDIKIMDLPRPKKEKILPKVLSKQEVKRILGSLDNIKHKTILYLIYSAGLRVSEAASIKISDIDNERMMIKVTQGKGRKDRYVMLSENVLEQLRIYYKAYRPKEWLFEGATGDKHITERTIQHVFKNACNKGNIKKNVSVHSLRHYVKCLIMVSG